MGNWNQRRARQTWELFARRGHRQIIATYCDRAGRRQVVKGRPAAAEGVAGIDGIMDTTWSNDYRD